MDSASSDHRISHGRLASPHASEAGRLDDARPDRNHQRKREAKTWTIHQQEHGIVSRLFVACLQSLQCVVQHADSASLSKRDLNALRRSVSTLLLWGDGYGVQTGALENKLKHSKHLHRTTLSLFRSLCATLPYALTNILPGQSESSEALALRAACRGLYDETTRVLEHTKQKKYKKTSDSNSMNDSDTDEDSGTDDDEEGIRFGDQSTLFSFTSFVADVLLYTSCLTDLGMALGSSALYHEHNVETEPIALYESQVATEEHTHVKDARVESTTRLVDGSPQNATPSSTRHTVTEAPIPVDTAELKVAENQQTLVQPAVPVSKKSNSLQTISHRSIFDYSYEETFAALDANGPFTVLDLKDLDSTWATRSRLATPVLSISNDTPGLSTSNDTPGLSISNDTPGLSTSNDTPSTRQSDIFETDGFQIDLDVGFPDAWSFHMSGDNSLLDVQLRDDLQTLGATPTYEDTVSLFPYMEDIQAIEKRMDAHMTGPEGLGGIPNNGPLIPHGSTCTAPVDVSSSLGVFQLEHEYTNSSPETTMHLNYSDLYGDAVEYHQNQQTRTGPPVPLPCIPGTSAPNQSGSLEKDEDRIQCRNHGRLKRDCAFQDCQTSFETPEAPDDDFQSAPTILAANNGKTCVYNTFKCKDTTCHNSALEFKTQTELDAHMGTAHTDNPLQFALGSMTESTEMSAKTSEPKNEATASKPTAKPAPVPANTDFQLPSSSFARPTHPAINPAYHNPPCNTLYVGNLPRDADEDELKELFAKQPGYKRLCFRTKQNGPMCLVEFEDTSSATKTRNELYSHMLKSSTKGGIRLSFSKRTLGVRTTSHADAVNRPTSTQPITTMPPPGIPTGYGPLINASTLRPANACAREQHSTDATSAASRTYRGEPAGAVVQKDREQKASSASNAGYYR